jgi:hypothetical protein
LNSLKKYAVLVLLGIQLLPLALIISFQVEKELIRFEAREALELAQLQEIKLLEKNIVWEEDGKELLVNGKLFDVYSSGPASNGYIVLKGLFDDKENQLYAQVDAMVNRKPNFTVLLAQIISLQSPTQIKGDVFFGFKTFPISITYYTYKEAIIGSLVSIISPPPKNRCFAI